MTTDPDRMIADAKRAARRLARTCDSTYQECLDVVAQRAGRHHWGAFLADPTDVRRTDTSDTPVGTTSTTRAGDDEGSPADGVAPPIDPTAPTGIHSERAFHGEGIVLGIDDDGRIIRSSRRSTVLCVGEPATGKTTGIVLPTIAMSTGASQIIHDPKPELLSATMSMGLRPETGIIVLDFLRNASPPGVKTMCFNPLHPAFSNGEGAWRHASRVASVLIPEREDRNGYFETRGRMLLTAVCAYLMLNPERIQADGDRKRIASLPAVLEWMGGLHSGGMRASFQQIIEDCADSGDGRRISQEIVPLLHMGDRERSDILGTMDQGLIPVKNREAKAVLDPLDPEDGAKILRAFADPAQATTLFLCGNAPTAPAVAVLVDLTIDVLAHWRSTLGPSQRSLQIILDEYTRPSRSPMINSMLQGEAPAGTALLMVRQNLSIRSGAMERQADALPNARFDHAVSLLHGMTSDDAKKLGELTRSTGRWDGAAAVAADWSKHCVIDRDGPTHLHTPRLFPDG